eukprot:scaffold8738_cov146-Isochrysis_galbana.AAC.2
MDWRSQRLLNMKAPIVWLSRLVRRAGGWFLFFSSTFSTGVNDPHSNGTARSAAILAGRAAISGATSGSSPATCDSCDSADGASSPVDTVTDMSAAFGATHLFSAALLPGAGCLRVCVCPARTPNHALKPLLFIRDVAL